MASHADLGNIDRRDGSCRTEYMLRKPQHDQSGTHRRKDDAKRKAAQPGWADGLRKLYDDVVSEPLPESFHDLLAKLDQADDG